MYVWSGLEFVGLVAEQFYLNGEGLLLGYYWLGGVLC